MASPSASAIRDARLVDPRSAYPRPPFPEQAQRLPGTDLALDPAPDHGESTYRGSGRLDGLATIVTGADSGIGKAVALAFAREGADVVVAYLSEHPDAAGTVRMVEEAGRRAVPFAGDLRDEATCRRLVDTARRELGGIDVLVNNAAFQRRRDRIEDIPTEEWDETLQTNLSSMFWLCREAVPGMRPGASIINTASIQAVHPSANLLAYATTKGGIVTFSKALSAQLAERGIRVNVVAPGPVWTPLVIATTPPEANAKFGADTPLGRPAQPAELAPAFVYLASPESGYVTGQVLAVTGGEPFV
jgi:NAD(P)-dependent dehydrogenase (short-subunit alcohol dehydrogenase family)